MESMMSFFKNNNFLYFTVATWLMLGLGRVYLIKDSVFEKKEVVFDVIVPNVESVCLYSDITECISLPVSKNSRIYSLPNKLKRTNIIMVVPRDN